MSGTLSTALLTLGRRMPDIGGLLEDGLAVVGRAVILALIVTAKWLVSPWS